MNLLTSQNHPYLNFKVIKGAEDCHKGMAATISKLRERIEPSKLIRQRFRPDI